jgi:ABC-type multidrug transport system fused ATPase/permease subunit
MILNNWKRRELILSYQLFTFINAIIAGLTTSFSLSLVFIITSLVPLAIQPLFNKTITNRSKQWQEKNTNYTEKVNELIDSYPVSTLYNAQGSLIKRFKLTAKVMENALKRMNQSSNYANELMTTVAYLVSMIIPYAFGVYLSMRNIITIGTLMMISQLSNNFVNPLLFINQYINQIKTTKEIWKKCEAAVNEV